jgi:hypothetical protein
MDFEDSRRWITAVYAIEGLEDSLGSENFKHCLIGQACSFVINLDNDGVRAFFLFDYIAIAVVDKISIEYLRSNIRNLSLLGMTSFLRPGFVVAALFSSLRAVRRWLYWNQKALISCRLNTNRFTNRLPMEISDYRRL